MNETLLYYFEGIDETILKLNPFISNQGFEFVKYSLNEFERIFIHLFTDDTKHFMKHGDFLDDGTSVFFFNSVVNSRYFNSDEIFRKNNYAIFLRDIDCGKYSTEDRNRRLKILIAKLKLHKSGHINLISSSNIYKSKEEWHFPEFPTVYAYPSKEENSFSLYCLDEGFPDLKFFEQELLIPDYLELAFNSFLEYYHIEDEKLKFVILIIALESIFNKSGQDPIAHIISRHIALLTTKDKESFLSLFEKVKKLYNVRSTIVHGKHDKSSKVNLKELKTQVLQLEGVVRSVLKKLIWIHDFDSNKPKDKEELWEYLNAKGFQG